MSADIGRAQAQQTTYSQPGMVVAHNQARDADMRALVELTRALDKKVLTSSFFLSLKLIIDVYNSFGNILMPNYPCI